jgi:hypothetical protein
MSKEKMPFKPNAVDLDMADDRMYQDFMIREGFRDGKVWILFLEPERIDRTVELMRNTKSSLEQQLGSANRTQNGGEPEWRKRTLNLLRIVDNYLLDARGEVKRLDAEEREESAEGERDEWQRLAGLLVDLLGDNPALNFITLPNSETTAAQWSTLRSEKVAIARLKDAKARVVAA